MNDTHFFKYKGFRNKFCALWMMQFGHDSLVKTNGLQLYKLIGSGKEGFNPPPDCSLYSVLQIRGNEAGAETFLNLLI